MCEGVRVGRCVRMLAGWVSVGGCEWGAVLKV